MPRKEKSLSVRGYSANERTRIFRPNTAGTNKFLTLRVKTDSAFNSPPPIIFTMPNNRKMTSGMGNKIEKEQLYENNMQLKEALNKLKRELAETKYNVVKKDILLREKEKIIRSFLNESDLESVQSNKKDKAKESAKLTLLKENYNELKNNYEKECQENKILKANIKLTKIKEFQIENDIFSKELQKIKSLYKNCKKNLKKSRKINEDLNNFKDKFLEQHTIISSYETKCNLLNAENQNLKEERDKLQRELEINIKKQEKLKQSNVNLKLKNMKFLRQKKIKEEIELKTSDYEKKNKKLKKDVYELNRALNIKIDELSRLNKEKDQKKINSDHNILKRFDYNKITNIEKENKNYENIELYKSLYDESQLKNIIYEKYFKERNLRPEDIIKQYGYNGILNTNNRLLLLQQKKSEKDMLNSKYQNIINENEKQTNNNTSDKKSTSTTYNINNNINTIKEEEEEDRKETLNQGEQGGDDAKTKNSENNASKSNTKANSHSKTYGNNNNQNNNINSINSKINNEGDEDDKIVEMDYEEDIENKFLTLIHIFLKNFEANHITTDILDYKMKSIFESFEGKTESSKEDFLSPFINLFLESMKVTQDSDKQIVVSFFNEYLDFLKGNTNEFFNELNNIFENLMDYSTLDFNEQVLNSLAFNLQKFKSSLTKSLNEYDKKGTNLITFDIFRKIVNDINLPLDDELMEFLLYKMKSSVPSNHSIFDLNYRIIIDSLNRSLPKDFDENEKINENEPQKENIEEEEDNNQSDLSRRITDKLSQFKNNMTNDNTSLEKVFEDKVKIFNENNNKYECIEKDVFFGKMEEYGVTVEGEIKETIYRLFINEEPICTNNGSVSMMDFTKLKSLFSTNYYSENE